MEVTVYSTTGCNMCKMFKDRLTRAGIPFDVVDDNDVAIALGNRAGILSAPVVEVDGELLNAQSAAKKLGLV